MTINHFTKNHKLRLRIHIIQVFGKNKSIMYLIFCRIISYWVTIHFFFSLVSMSLFTSLLEVLFWISKTRFDCVTTFSNCLLKNRFKFQHASIMANFNCHLLHHLWMDACIGKYKNTWICTTTFQIWWPKENKEFTY